MDTVVTPIRIEPAFDDPALVRSMIEQLGPYRAIAGYIPQDTFDESERRATEQAVVPWFRGTWALGGEATVPDADGILHNPRFVEAARRLFDTPHVKPETVVVNVNAPMPAGDIHVDIPSFRGATRVRFPLRLLMAMGASGLFEPWRVVEAGAIVWFYDGVGGAYEYWPDGLAGPMHREGPPFANIALVADNDRMYHRIGQVGDPAAPPPRMSPAAQIDHVGGVGWQITEAGESRARYADGDVRLSVLWKAEVGRDANQDDAAGELTPARIADIFTRDLADRGLEPPTTADPTGDDAWIDLVHRTYLDPARTLTAGP